MCSLYRFLLLVVFCLVLFPVTAFVVAQEEETESDPFVGNYRLGNSAEIMFMRRNFDQSDQVDFRPYDYLNLNNPELDNQLQPGEMVSESGVTGTDGDKTFDIISGDLNGDNADDIVAVWEGPDRSIIMAVPEIDPTTYGWTNSNATTVPGAQLIDSPISSTDRWLSLACGNFDTDSEEEFLLAYWGTDSMVNITLYDTDGSLFPQARADISDIALPTSGGGMTERSARFAIANGDLDGDGTDEVIVAAGQPIPGCSVSQGCWRVELFFYDYDEENQVFTSLDFPEEDRILWEKTNNSSRWLIRIGVVAADVDADGFDEVACVFEEADNSSQPEWYITVLDVADDLSGISERLSDAFQFDQTTGNNGYAMTMAAADLTNNGSEEILVDSRSIHVFRVDSTRQVIEWFSGGFTSDANNGSQRSLVVADLDAENSVAVGDTAWRPEIVVARLLDFQPDSEPNYTEVWFKIYGVIPNEAVSAGYSIQEVGEYQGERHENLATSDIYLAAGDFGRNGVRLGKPQKYTRTDIVEPIVILNAPPTHFDRFGDTNFDITNCYDGSCDFSATYSTTTERTVETSTTFNNDWSVGAKVEGGFSIPILKVGVETKLETKYGKAFSKRTRDKQTFTVSQSISAIADDWIYAVIADYDIWEYPLYLDNEIEGYVSVVIPKSRERAWFDSKSFNAFTYIPAHEVGNILSYQEITEPAENSALDVAVRWETGDRITLNNNTDATWNLTQENQQQFSTKNKEKKFIGGSVSFDIPFKFLPNVEINGHYRESSISTYSSTVTDRKGLSIGFKGIDLSAGNTRYSVTPYAYWAKNGALVLDYAVKPELPPNPLDPATWWSQNYGEKPDATFILPWKLDPEKGLGIAEEAQRWRTRDIIFEPAEPQPGEVVTIKARIQNFSILPTIGPVKVRFFMDDPDDGGTLIESIVGQTEVFTQTAIAARGNAVVQMQWQLPDDITRFTRIYAQIDPDNIMDEIHENNNKGWTVLFVADGSPTSVAAGDISTMPEQFSLQQNYPNPFNPATEIKYALPKDSHVVLSVFNMLGQEVARLVDRRQVAGSYTATFRPGPMSSGMYIYRLEAGDFVETRKMLLLK